MMPMGPGIAQILQQLLQSPAAMQGMQNFMQGMPPGQGIDQMAMQGAPMPMPQEAPMPMPPEGGGEPPVDDAEAMATDAIDSAGQTWDGVDAPTKNDIQRLMEDPEGLKASFDAQFGDGMADKYIGTESSPEEAPPEESTEEPEY